MRDAKSTQLQRAAASAASIVYRPRPDATPEGEIAALAAAYSLILDCHAKKKGTRPGAPNDAKEIKNDCAATENYIR